MRNYSIYATHEYTIISTYYILLCCVTCEYSMTSHSYDKKLIDLRDARVHYYYSLLERYMKHIFVAGLVTGDF